MTTAKKTASKADIVEAVKGIISRYDTRLTLRQIYYQLVSKHIIPNVISQYKRLSKILVEARHAGEIPWYKIEDRSRAASGGDRSEKTVEEHFEDAKDYFRDAHEYFALPKWKDQPKYVEVWFEKQALQGIFQSVTGRWNVTQMACKGYASHTVGYEFSGRVEDIEDKEIYILYFGDHDPSGVDIYRFIQEMCERFGVDVQFERCAITPEQIEKYNIPPMMAKTSDSRYEGFVADYGTDAVELDALDPNVLKELIDKNVLKHFDDKIYNEVLKKQKDMREEIKEMVDEVLGPNEGDDDEE